MNSSQVVDTDAQVDPVTTKFLDYDLDPLEIGGNLTFAFMSTPIYPVVVRFYLIENTGVTDLVNYGKYVTTKSLGMTTGSGSFGSSTTANSTNGTNDTTTANATASSSASSSAASSTVGAGTPLSARGEPIYKMMLPKDTTLFVNETYGFDYNTLVSLLRVPSRNAELYKAFAELFNYTGSGGSEVSPAGVKTSTGFPAEFTSNDPLLLDYIKSIRYADKESPVLPRHLVSLLNGTSVFRGDGGRLSQGLEILFGDDPDGVRTAVEVEATALEKLRSTMMGLVGGNAGQGAFYDHDQLVPLETTGYQGGSPLLYKY